MQKGLAPIVIILLIALAVGGFLIYQKQSKISISSSTTNIASPALTDETINWNTYTNTKFNYSVKYPNKVQLITQNPEFGIKQEEMPGISLLLDGGSPSYKEGFINVIDPQTLTIIENPQARSQWENLNLDQFVQKIWELNKNDKNPYIPNKQVGEIIETQVDGRRALKFSLSGSYIIHTGEGTLKEEHSFIFIDYNNKKYFLMFPSRDNTFSQILATFKFIN